MEPKGGVGQMPTRQMLTGQMIANEVAEWTIAHEEKINLTKQNIKLKLNIFPNLFRFHL